MVMEVQRVSLPGLLLIKPQVFFDQRGHFAETFNQARERRHNVPADYVQDNESRSQKHILRGLHFQVPPYDQAKLVRVAAGKVLDVAVDLRVDSPTYGHHYAVELSSENHLQLFIPSGFAHGFLTLEDDTLFLYKCSQYYHKASEGGLHWNDPDLNIDWPVDDPLVSDKDQKLPSFGAFQSPFSL
jgi:dTDP-4-dehydrorhamnose 3,5-epimerase